MVLRPEREWMDEKLASDRSLEVNGRWLHSWLVIDGAGCNIGARKGPPNKIPIREAGPT